MQSRESVERLIEDAAPLLGSCEVMPCGDRAAWRLVLDGDTTFDVEFDHQSMRIMLICDIGPVHEAARPAVRDLLLQFNYLWLETAGARMALDGFPGHAVLMLDLHAQVTTPSHLCAALEQMTATQRRVAGSHRGGRLRLVISFVAYFEESTCL